MQAIFEIDANRRTPKYQQIVNSVTKAIKDGRFKKGDRIFSINELSNECFLSRDTVQRAYELLEREKIIEAVKGKGYYIRRTDLVVPYRILLVFNKLSDYKKMVYDSFVRTLGRKAAVELKIHHNNLKVFEEMLNTDRFEYDFYVVMPHFYDHTAGAIEVMKRLPAGKLLLLDKDLPGTECRGVVQDFENDIVEALETGLTSLKKYHNLICVHPTIVPYPPEILSGFRKFVRSHGFNGTVLNEITPETPVARNEAYIVIEEMDLVNLIKKCRAENLVIGRDVGIISYNETPMKQILLDGVSVISTDHAKMGETAAQMILENKGGTIKNPFTLILRNSL